MKLVVAAALLLACTKEALTAAQYEARNTALMTEITAVFATGGKDCPTLAAGIDTFMTKHASDMAAVVAFEAAEPSAHASYQLRTGLDLERAFAKQAAPALEACAGNEAFKTAWARFTSG